MDQNWESLIDFSKLPSGLISGKEGFEIENIAKSTTSNIAQYPELNKSIIEELEKSENILKNVNTVDQTERYVNQFFSYLRENNLPTDIEKNAK